MIETLTLIISPIIGAITGWFASLVMKEGDFGLAGDIVLGIIGALLGAYVLPQSGVLIGGQVLGSIINSFVGACAVLLVFRPFVRRG